MYKIVIIVLLVIYFSRELLLFPYVEKYITSKNVLSNGNVLLLNDKTDEITLFFPGNAMSIYRYSHFFTDKNYLFINYRQKKSDNYFYGFGDVNTAVNNSLDAYNYAIKNFKKINVVTFSIGNGVFSELLGKIKTSEKIFSVKSINGLPNLSDLLYSYFGFFGNFLNLNYLETEKNYEKYLKCPYTILHGTKDTVIPFYLAKKMYFNLKKNNKNVKFFVLENEGHNLNLFDYI